MGDETINDVGIFWSHDYWLPAGYNWKDLESDATNNLPNFWHIFIYPIIIAAILLFIRLYTNKFFIYWANYLNIESIKSKNLSENNIQHSSDKVNTDAVSQTDAESISKNAKPVKGLKHSDRFSENCYETLFHMTFRIYVLISLWDKDWFWNIPLCCRKYPQPVTDDVWLIYMISFGYFWYDLLWYLIVPGYTKKERVTRSAHHIISMLLIFISWTVRLVRTGSIFLLLNWQDGLSFLSVIYKYAGKDTTSKVLIIMKTISWFITRVLIFPYWFVKSLMFAKFELEHLIEVPIAYVFYGLMVATFISNFFWFIILTKASYRRIQNLQLMIPNYYKLNEVSINSKIKVN